VTGTYRWQFAIETGVVRCRCVCTVRIQINNNYTAERSGHGGSQAGQSHCPPVTYCPDCDADATPAKRLHALRYTVPRPTEQRSSAAAAAASATAAAAGSNSSGAELSDWNINAATATARQLLYLPNRITDYQ